MADLWPRLLNAVPLLRYVISQSQAPICERPVDMRWYYEGIVPISVAGFNPLRKRVFIGRNSHLGRVISGAAGDDVPLEWLLYEAFFAVHDYIHIWAVATLLSYFPHLRAGLVDPDPRVEADLTFVLVMSEVAATAGLDYWLLARRDLSAELGIECNFRALTTSFRHTDLDRVKRIAPKFTLEGKEFFRWLTKAYCTGVFDGFEDFDDEFLKTNASWIMKEKKMSMRQRQLMARWISHMTGTDCRLHTVPVLDCMSEGRSQIIGELAFRLWREFDPELGPTSLPLTGNSDMRLPSNLQRCDFRFVDLINLDRRLVLEALPDITVRQFGYLAAQFVSGHSFSTSCGFGANEFDEHVRARDWAGLVERFGPCELLSENPNDSPHLFLPN